MFRTLITIGLSVAVGISSTLIVQRITVHVTPQAPVACLAPLGNPAGLQELDTTYTPQGQVLPMPLGGKAE